MKHVTRRLVSLMFLSCLMLPLGAQAQVDIPQTITIAGEIEAFGANATSTLTVEVAMFDVATGGTSLWNEEVLVTPNQGYVELELGSVSPLGPAFEGGATHIEIKIGNETLSPRLPISALPYAHQAGNSNRLEGKTLAEIKGELGSGQIDQQTIDALMDRIDVLEAKVAELESKTAPMEYNTETKTLEVLGANLAIEQTQPGTGNLLIGSPLANVDMFDATHSIIMGQSQYVTGSGHIISGAGHNVMGTNNTILGGGSNSVQGSDHFLAVSNGMNIEKDTSNVSVIQSTGPTYIDASSASLISSWRTSSVSSSLSTIIGSRSGSVTANAIGSVSIGGSGNTIRNNDVVVIGGTDNDATGEEAIVIGGKRNQALGAASIMLNGQDNIAHGLGSMLYGGSNNQCSANANGAIIMSGSTTTCTQTDCQMFARQNASDQ